MLANKMRTSLSSLGIIIWVFSVVALLAFGQGLRNNILWQLWDLGSNTITIFPGAKQDGDVRTRRSTSQRILTHDHVDMLRSMDAISLVSPVAMSSRQVIYGSANTDTKVYGVTPDYLAVNAIEVWTGVFISVDDDVSRRKVAVIWPEIATTLFKRENPMGKTIRIDNTLFTVIGITVAKGKSEFSDTDSNIYIPLSTAQISITGSPYYSSIATVVVSEDLIDKTNADIKSNLMKMMSIVDEKNAPFSTSTSQELLQTVATISTTINLFLWGIAAISLIVWGIGVMNILLVTVSERTKEIGIRKAIGAKNSDIIEQFLTESVMLTLFGGLIGLIIAYIVVYLVIVFVDGFSPQVTVNHILLALWFSISTGIFFGIFPAYKAAKMKPIDALRSE